MSARTAPQPDVRRATKCGKIRPQLLFPDTQLLDSESSIRHLVVADQGICVSGHPSRNKTHSCRPERRPSGPSISWARTAAGHQRNSAVLRTDYAASLVLSTMTSIETRRLPPAAQSTFRVCTRPVRGALGSSGPYLPYPHEPVGDTEHLDNLVRHAARPRR